jgi:hypothetical protein
VNARKRLQAIGCWRVKEWTRTYSQMGRQRARKERERDHKSIRAEGFVTKRASPGVLGATVRGQQGRGAGHNAASSQTVKQLHPKLTSKSSRMLESEAKFMAVG